MDIYTSYKKKRRKTNFKHTIRIRFKEIIEVHMLDMLRL